MNGVQTVDRILEARGILDAARRAGWKSVRRYDVDGWLYPVSPNYPGVFRWKRAEPSETVPKYAWVPNGDHKPRYYALPGIQKAIAQANGVLYIASGEPDVLAYHAAGIPNCLCWYGELNVPEQLAQDLKKLAVTRVIYAPDRDRTGVESAVKVADLLRGSGIAYEVLALPADLQDKAGYDINRLWIDCQFDAARFQERLKTLPRLDLPASGTTPPPPPALDVEALYERWCLLIEDAARRRWNITEPKANDFSRRNITCPFHDDTVPSASWNYETHGIHCFKCGEHNTHEVAATLGEQAWDEFKRDALGPLPYSSDGIQPPRSPNGAKPPAPSPADIRVVSSDDAMTRVLDWFDGLLDPVEPVLSPYRAMHKLGGMAELWEPRKLIYIIGGAGLGKTAFMETGADILRQRGQDVIYWGPEWSPEEVQMKAIARYGGPLFHDQRLHHLWMREEKAGIPVEKRRGKRLTDEQLSLVLATAATINEWPGKAYYLDRGNVPIEVVLARLADLVRQLRETGRKPVAFFCDYLQKTKLTRPNNNWNELELKASLIGEAMSDLELVGVIASQVGKPSSRALRSNKLLDESSAQALSDQQCNLYITLNPEFDADGNRLETATLVVAKNSSGYAPAKVRVKTALQRHFWTDVELPLRPEFEKDEE